MGTLGTGPRRPHSTRYLITGKAKVGEKDHEGPYKGRLANALSIYPKAP